MYAVALPALLLEGGGSSQCAETHVPGPAQLVSHSSNHLLMNGHCPPALLEN
jgi:hypothetical protein